MGIREDWEFRNILHQFTDESIFGQLDTGSVTLYAGFDPTAKSLHLGNLLQLTSMRRLQLAGNRPIALAGGGTGLIGDPSHKATERQLLSMDELQENVAGIRRQLEKFLDFSATAGPSQALLLNNADWLTKISLTDFLRDTGKHFTVNQMIAKDSVKSRLDRPDVGISFTEFSYMLLQAYDFLHLHQEHGCTMQLGGSDQWGNITMGAELVRKVAGGSAYGVTSPLLVKSDGTKFGKSESGAMYLDPEMTSPFAMHQFFLNTEDSLVIHLLKSFTFLSHDEINELEVATKERAHERLAQRTLANEVVAYVHSRELAQAAEQAGRALFSETIRDLDEATLMQVMADAPSSTVSRQAIIDGKPLLDLLVECGLATSRGESRRFIDQGGVYLNNLKAEGETVGLSDVLHDRYVVLRRGRRQTHLVVLA
jgi:tyrosyl-tRNA synthetase